MTIANQVVYTVIHNIAIAIFIVILCLAFVGLVFVIEWLFTCVLDFFNIFSDREHNKREKRHGHL